MSPFESYSSLERHTPKERMCWHDADPSDAGSQAPLPQTEVMRGRRWEGKRIVQLEQNFPFGSCHIGSGNQGGIQVGRGEKVKVEVGVMW